MTLEERVDMILSSIERVERFGGVEVLKAGVHRDRGGLFLRITIDRDGGVDTALCEAVSQYVSRCVDAMPPPVPPYQVEVESAGVERPLLKPAHYQKFVGRGARIITSLRIQNRTEFSGPIAAATDESVTISDTYAGSVEIPYPAIKRAHLTFEIREDLRRK